MQKLAQKSGREIRQLMRENKEVRPTSGMAAGYTQANLVVLPQDLAYDFLLFAQRNPKPCPVLDVTEAGSPEPALMAPEADLRYDIGRYCVYRQGQLVEEPADIAKYWTSDMVGFLLGCSFTFETSLLKNGIGIRHMEENCNVPMYITNLPCRPAGRFAGPTVVSMRPVPACQVVRAIQVTSRFPAVHGAPVHVGDPAVIGIANIHKPDFGDAVTIRPGEVPMFWACGVTPQAVAMQIKPEIMITHAPGYMFVCDSKDDDLSVF